MKHFIEIENARFCDDEYKLSNCKGFEPGDYIVIQEKIDGSNASVCWNKENNELECFSHRNRLTFNNTLNGFYNYVMSFDSKVIEWFKNHPDYVVFGEWNLNCNKIKSYEKDYRKSWIVYDVYDKASECWLKQDIVKQFAEETGIQLIHTLYEGEFKSWNFVNNLPTKILMDRTKKVISLKTKLN